MYKEKDEINQIKKLLTKKRLFNLTPINILKYLIYRINKISTLEFPVAYNEIKYNLSEVGHGKRRLDPLSINIILNSKKFSEIGDLQKRTFNNIDFYLSKKPLRTNVDAILDLKAKSIVNLTANEKSVEVVDAIFQIIERKVAQNIESISKPLSSINEGFFEIVFYIKDLNNSFILRFYNSTNWVYPYSSEIWDLYKKAIEGNYMPILVSPYIHGSCFQLFKKIGMFARLTYNSFLLDSYDNILNSIFKSDALSALVKRNFKVGKYETIKTPEFVRKLEIMLNSLLDSIYTFHEAYKVNYNVNYKNRDSILKYIENSLPSNIYNIVPSEKIEKFKDIIRFMKLTRNRNLLRLVNYYKKLDKSLND